ncbi:hypothetical protein PFICI_14507 [Pestalotiopsis fici W106-1]|uniref:Apple domain-containing protein n=1 Tax=Pestalotiopsis fici (strain W106-1 / CGMCC3.15140) TaxID=1229662 RepID=W3WL72_PESFW|nr:uncharacterized protein PFICI_14507 [Pestalotiopsis fici W106-1]ETS73561.1 hypothetical protein PFICI_14507 [Pestalotiopsis fici W106-1]
MKLLAVPTLLRCALLSSIVLAAADQPRLRPRARYSYSEAPRFPEITGSHSQPFDHKKAAPDSYGNLEGDLDVESYAIGDGADLEDDDYSGDGGGYAHGYPSGNNDETPFEDDPEYDDYDAHDFEEDRHGSSHSGHYSQGGRIGHSKDSKYDASRGSDRSYHAAAFDDEDLGYGTHDSYGQDMYDPIISTSSAAASDLSYNLPDGSSKSTVSTTPTTSSNTITDSSTTSTRVIPSATQILCPDKDSQCVDNFLIGCAKIFNPVDRPSVISRQVDVPGVTNPQICHQLCVEDPLCLAWADADEPEFFFGGCSHYVETIVLNSTDPFLGSLQINSFGLRGFCDLAIPESTLTTAVKTPLTTTSQSSTPILTSSSASSNLPTIPTSETSLCPQLDGQCLNSNIIRCDRDLDLDVDPPWSNYVCVTPLPIITSERECHESCNPDFTCIGWKMTQVLADASTGVGGGTGECCHVFGSVVLQDPLPQQQPLATFPEYNSYGLRFRCDDGGQSEELCPKAENTCLDGFLIKCDRFLEDDLTPATAQFTNDWRDDIFSQLGCHQACAEDLSCTAWGGYSEPLDSGEGGGEMFDCYHVHTPVVLQSPLPGFVSEPDPGSSARYGVRGACQ